MGRLREILQRSRITEGDHPVEVCPGAARSSLLAETEELAEEAAAVAVAREQELVELAAVEVDPFAGGALFHLDSFDFLRHHLAAAFGALAPVSEPARLFFGALPFLFLGLPAAPGFLDQFRLVLSEPDVFTLLADLPRVPVHAVGLCRSRHGCGIYNSFPAFQRKRSSRAAEASVFASRYLTMTGVCRERPHSLPFPSRTARAPGTTTAPAGISRGCPGFFRYSSPRGTS